MGYTYKINKSYRVKKAGLYPAPCPADPKRILPLDTSDVLTGNVRSGFTVHTGICITGFKLTKSQIKFVNNKVALTLI